MAVERRTAARHGEVRWPAVAAIIVGGVLHTALPQGLLLQPRWLAPSVEAVLLVSLIAVNPVRLTTETQWSRIASLALVTVIIVANLVSLTLLIRDLTSSQSVGGRGLLLAAFQVWLTNMIAFALVFWELDRGGAVARLPSSGVDTRKADFLFPQDDPNVARMETDGQWIPEFVDYLFLSVTNSTAFSPTDTLPLSRRAKVLMSVEAITALTISLLVVARAVNVLR
jgi:uncharacterized membrane protein